VVERHWRDAGGAWQQETLAGAGEVAFPCPRVTLTRDETDEGVTIAPVPPRRVRERRAPAYG
jgi:hypothetical protein